MRAGVDPQTRGEQLDVAAFARIAARAKQCDIAGGGRRGARTIEGVRWHALNVTVRVPAKVNLHLGVGPLRPDGKHQLHTIYQAVSLYDEVMIEPSTDGSLTCRPGR